MTVQYIIKLISSIVCILIFSANISANPKTTEQLRAECSKYLEKRDFRKALEKAILLEKAGVESDDLKSIGYANFYMGAAQLFLGKSAESLNHINRSKEIASQISNDSLTGLALNCLGIYEGSVNSNFYLAQHYFMESLNYPGEDGGTYVNLAQIARLQRDTSGMEYARKSYEYGQRKNELHYIYSGLTSIAEFHILKGEYALARPYLTKGLAIAEKYGYKDRSRILFLEALIISHEGNTKESTQILMKILPDVKENLSIYLPELLYVLGKNYEKENRFDESNKWLTEAANTSIELGSTVYLGPIYRLIADNYRRLGNSGKAFDYMEKAYEVEEHAAESERKRMMNERKLTLDKIHQEQQRQLAEQKAQNRRTVIIILSLLLVVAISAIIYVIITMRKRHKLYNHIVHQNLNMIDEEERTRQRIIDLEERIKGYEDKNKIQSASREAKSRELFASLQELMEKEQLYRNPQLTREDIIDRLKTNSTYLTNAIKENVSMNYAQYINSFRIREAIRLLSDKQFANTPIKQISEEVGCNSITTFYKLFQQATGISPSAFRKSAIHI